MESTNEGRFTCEVIVKTEAVVILCYISLKTSGGMAGGAWQHMTPTVDAMNVIHITCCYIQRACTTQVSCQSLCLKKSTNFWNSSLQRRLFRLKGKIRRDIVMLGHCKSKFTCGKNSRQCYTAEQRCDGVNNCDHRTDELHCCESITWLSLLYMVAQ